MEPRFGVTFMDGSPLWGSFCHSAVSLTGSMKPPRQGWLTPWPLHGDCGCRVDGCFGGEIHEGNSPFLTSGVPSWACRIGGRPRSAPRSAYPPKTSKTPPKRPKQHFHAKVVWVQVYPAGLRTQALPLMDTTGCPASCLTLTLDLRLHFGFFLWLAFGGF